ncbi:hypothetical protein [Arthrobacter sp. UYEF36]|uniref:hypothetical protein n=1 Tax=Arthrobacter sp. UYEF36 TaxID=1756366 RepID=UPI00339202AC
MRAKRLVIAGVGVAAILGGTSLVLDQMTAGPTINSSLAAPDASMPPGAAVGTGPGGTDAASAPAAGGGAAMPDGGAAAGGSAPAPGGREVLPPVKESPPGLPVPSPPVPLISLPLPATASSQGTIVDGFPGDVIPFPEGTTVVSTAVSAADGSLQVSADCIVALTQDSVAGHFQQVLGGLKFWSEPVPAAEGQRSVRFSRGADSVTLTASTTGTGSTRFMLLGNLHAAAGG